MDLVQNSQVLFLCLMRYFVETSAHRKIISPLQADSSGIVAKIFRPSMSTLNPIKSKYDMKVMNHFDNPRNIGSFKDTSMVGTGMVGAPACGDVLKLQLKVDKNGIVEDSKFKTFGCGSAIASSSLASEMVKGKTLEECLNISNKEIAKELALPPIKLHCSMLAEDAIKMAVSDIKSKLAKK